MKKYLLLLTILVLGTACNDYLDVKPSSEIDKDVLFATEEGFYESMVGIYSRCAEEDLYGGELSFGLPDVLAQNYSIGTSDFFRYRPAMQYNYEDQDFIARKNRLWAGLYNAISNCNILLEKLEEKKAVFRDANTAKLIKGEALAIRAYLHFDALRLFAPSHAQGAGEAGIPYVTSFTNKVTPREPVAGVLDKIIADLLEAKALLKEADPIVTEGYVVGYTLNGDANDLPDDGSTEELNELFLQNRRHRMNYYAVCGSLARVYLYKEDKQKALEHALEVINSGKLQWTKKEDFITDDPQLKDRILYKELVFAWYIPARKDHLRTRFEHLSNSTSTYASEGNLIFETGGPGAEDLRYKQWLKEDSDGLFNRLYVQKYRRDDNEGNLHHLVAPGLRLSEMYYIAAECVFDADPAQAWEYFNLVRFNRGIGSRVEGENSREFFLNELIKEGRKEFFGEGQIFYMYKRLHRNIVGQSGSIYAASNSIFVLPLPDDEISFGQ
ncbi:RagB/SusD family nutrient uptake outer membrane protein [Cesiribacter sp. SM1]|uniref:RagB/SusD family nutrient uptake outer membrane protein n=1 Tax=Cesiribacter sp. SM1 TaxID=2861196 RepID=UPI001CD70B70|nr:RagB/SusD family nutrient uptake outer membrane protein [Cesiribacter sp. SM1]